MIIRVFPAAAVMTLLGTLGAFFFKQSSGGSSGLSDLLRCPKLYAGLGFYGVSALLNVFLLRFIDYSILYPMTALTYVWTLFLSWRFLGERITRRKVAGVLCIGLGVLLLTL